MGGRTAASHSLHMGQSGVWVPHSFSDSTLSSGWAAPLRHTAVLHCLRNFSGMSSPVCGHHSVLLAPHSF